MASKKTCAEDKKPFLFAYHAPNGFPNPFLFDYKIFDKRCN